MLLGICILVGVSWGQAPPRPVTQPDPRPPPPKTTAPTQERAGALELQVRLLDSRLTALEKKGVAMQAQLAAAEAKLAAAEAKLAAQDSALKAAQTDSRSRLKLISVQEVFVAKTNSTGRGTATNETRDWANLPVPADPKLVILVRPIWNLCSPIVTFLPREGWTLGCNATSDAPLRLGQKFEVVVLGAGP
jgi:hypothetical protein